MGHIGYKKALKANDGIKGFGGFMAVKVPKGFRGLKGLKVRFRDPGRGYPDDR